MDWAKRIHTAALTSLLTVASVGCTSIFPSTSSQAAPPPASTGVVAAPGADRQRWWKENEDRKVFVPGSGYAIPGVDGYFDANGRPIDEAGVQQVSFAPAQAQTTPLLFPSTDNLLDSNPLASTVNAVKSAVGKAPSQTAANELYQEGESLFRREQYLEAAEKFEQAAKRWPDSTLEHEALFWQAESLFFADRYPAAVDAIQKLVKQYPGSRHLDVLMQREYSIARYWQESYQADPQWPITPNLTDETRYYFDTLGHALRAYEHIRLSDPTGDYADEALLATANANFLRGKYGEADYHYGLLRSDYPKSDHLKMAHLLGLQAKLMRYQGEDYDGAVLDEAEKLAESTLTIFSAQELGDDRDRVYDMRAQIATLQAMRVWNRAEYYAKGEYYAAARFYYERIVKDYPTTAMAEEARSRMGEYASRPDRPTPPLERLASLVGLGGEPETAPAYKPPSAPLVETGVPVSSPAAAIGSPPAASEWR